MGAHGSKPTVTRDGRDEYASSEVQPVIANYLSSKRKASGRTAWEGQQCDSNYPKQGAGDEVTLAGRDNVRGNHSANATSGLTQEGTNAGYQERQVDKLVGQQQGDRQVDGCNQNSSAQPPLSPKEKQSKHTQNMAAAGAVALPSPAQKAESADAVQWVIRPGPPLDSVYKVGKVLGQGSFGVVRAATHRATGAHVAVKSIRKSLLAASDVNALRREVEILHHLSGHPAISQLLGVFEEASQLHLVLELYKGGDLFDAIIGCGRHSERVAADVMRTVLTAIAYCHAMGVAHRDIKPENFMLTAEQQQPHYPSQTTTSSSSQPPPPQQPPSPQRPKLGASGTQEVAPTLGARLKLIDFGLSAFCTDDTPLTEIVGTSYYVAPEVLEGRYSLSADVWSAGVILHIMLTGYAPFDGRDDKEILKAVRRGKLDLTTDPVWRSISPEATAVLKSMLERDPVKRASAEQLLSTPWLGRTPAACTASSTPLPGRVLDRLAAFARMSSFKKEARRVLAGLMRPEEVAGLVAQFRGLDADRDGRLSWDELKAGLTRQAMLRGSGHGVSAGTSSGLLSDGELRELLKRVDLNGDGILDESEFLGALLPAAAITRRAQAAAAALASTSEPGTSSAPLPRPDSAGEAVAAAFAHFDKDGSGYITTEELRRALAAHHPSRRGLDVAALLSWHDRDADGRISFPEFIDMLISDIEVEPDEAVQQRASDKAATSRGGGGGGAGVGMAQAVHGDWRGDLSLLVEDLTREEDAAGGGGGGGQKAGAGGGGRGVRAAGEPEGGCSGARVTTRSGGGCGTGGDGGKPSFAWAAEGDIDGGVPSSTTSAATRAAAAHMPSGRVQPLDWSDDCRGRVADARADDASAAAATNTTAPRGGPAPTGKGTASPALASPSAASRTPGGSPPIAPAVAGGMPTRPACRLVPTPPPVSAPLLPLAPQLPQSPCQQPQMARQSTPGAVTGGGGANVFNGRRASITGAPGTGRNSAAQSQGLPQPSPPTRPDPNAAADLASRGGTAAHRLACAADPSAGAVPQGFRQQESLLDEDMLPPLNTNSPRLPTTTSVPASCLPRALSRVSVGGARPQAPSGACPSLRTDIRSRRHSACEVQMPEGLGALGGGNMDPSAGGVRGHSPYAPLTVQVPSEPRSPLLPVTAGARGTTQSCVNDYGTTAYGADLVVVGSPRVHIASATAASGLMSLPGSPAAVGGAFGIGRGMRTMAGRHGSGVAPTPLSPSAPSPSPLSPNMGGGLRTQTSIPHQHLQQHHQHYHFQPRQSPQQPPPLLVPTASSPDRDRAAASPIPNRPSATPLSPSSSRRHPRIPGPGGIGIPVGSVPIPATNSVFAVTAAAGASSGSSAALAGRRSLHQITPIPTGPPSGTAQRVATPSAPLPLLTSTLGSRRQSTGSPFWQASGQVHPLPPGQQQAPAPTHVMTAPLMEVGSLGAASLRSRRSTAVGMGCEDLILTSRASVDMDLGLGVPLSGGLDDDDGSGVVVLSPAGGGGGAAAGWGYGLAYGAGYGGGNLTPSACGRR